MWNNIIVEIYNIKRQENSNYMAYEKYSVDKLIIRLHDIGVKYSSLEKCLMKSKEKSTNMTIKHQIIELTYSRL